MVGLKKTLSRTLRLLAIGATLGAVSACDHVRQHSVSQKHGDFTVLEADAADHLVYIGRRGNSVPVVCAMPSPDGITSRSTTGSLAAGVPKASGSAAFATSNAAAFIGMRTQTVQLLRDGYYRLCEAYMNQAISREQYNLALVSLPGVFASLMAIDTIAGAAVAPAVAVSAGLASTEVSNKNKKLFPGGSEASDGDQSVGGEDQNSVEQSSEGSAKTGELKGSVDIQELQRASAINEHGAKVLISALQGSRGGTYFMPAFCASILADGENGQPNGNRPYRDQFYDNCVKLLKDLSPTTVKNLDDTRDIQAEKSATARARAEAKKLRDEKKKADEKHKDTLKKLGEIQAAIAKIEQINNPSDQAQKDLKELQAKFLDLADDMARDLAKGASGEGDKPKMKNDAPASENKPAGKGKG